MVIYLDVVILLNLAVNSVILLLTAWLMDLSFLKWRLAAAALLLTAYVPVSLLWQEPLLAHPLLKLLVSLLAVRTAFADLAVRRLLTVLGAFYVVSFFLGGAALGFLTFGSRNLFSAAPVTLAKVAAGLTGGCALLYLFFKGMLRDRQRSACIQEVECTYRERSIRVRAFFDSGNRLYALGSGRPVLVLEQRAAQRLFSPAVARYLEQTGSAHWVSQAALCADPAWRTRMVLIAYHSVGGADFMLGCRLDEIKVRLRSGKWREFSGVAGIYPGCLSADGRYQALLHGSTELD